MRKEKTPKYSVEIKQSNNGHFYLGSLRIEADSEIEMEKLMDSALSSVMYKIGLMNKSKRKMKKLQKDQPMELSDSDDKRLFEELRRWRLERSRVDKVPPYVIFHDSTFKEIALRKPLTRKELFQISGIGPRKYEKYGVLLLKILHEFTEKSQGKKSETRKATESLSEIENLQSNTENLNSKVLLQGELVKIKKQSVFNGEIGKIVGYDGFKYYEIALKSIKKCIKCLKSEIEEVSVADIKNNEIYIKIGDNKSLKVKVQDLKPSIESFEGNHHIKSLYALGKYYSLKRDYNMHKNDYLSQKIIQLKSFNKEAAEKIAEIFLIFINKAEKLRSIINKTDYIVMMPTTKETNHVSLWGEKICGVLNIHNITKYVYINPEKVKYFKSYVSKSPSARHFTTTGAFMFDKSSPDFPSLKNRICLILDDVCTTGNQINELSNLLAGEGVTEVYCLVIGKTKY